MANRKARGIRDTFAPGTLLGNLGSIAAAAGPVTIAALAAILRPLILNSPTFRTIVTQTIVSANPTATASDTAVNGTAKTFMTSDSAPKVQKATTSAYGLVKFDGTSIILNGSNQLSTSSGLGLVPLVSGDTPGPSLMTDGSGQTIGVEYGSASPGASALILSYASYGLAASRPANPNVAAGATALYYATDTVHLYAWTGSVWQQIF